MGKSMWIIPPERLCLGLETLPWMVLLRSKLCRAGTRRSRCCEQRTSPRVFGDSPAVLPGGSVSLRSSPTLQRGRAARPCQGSELEAPLGLLGDGSGDGQGGGGGGGRGVPDVQDPAPHGPRASIEHKVIHQIPLAVQSLGSHT